MLDGLDDHDSTSSFYVLANKHLHLETTKGMRLDTHGGTRRKPGLDRLPNSVKRDVKHRVGLIGAACFDVGHDVFHSEITPLPFVRSRVSS